MDTKEIANQSFDMVGTSIVGKEYEPAICRRYSTPFLHWVVMICGDDLSKLDQIVTDFWESAPNATSIQDWRNICGALQEKIVKSFRKVESCAVVFAVDKMMVSSLYGDAMNHLGCRMETYALINTSNLL